MSIVEFNKKDNVFKCPFRTLTITNQQPDGSVTQLVEFPECHYDLCPLYNSEGKEKYMKCRRIEG